MDLRKPSGWFFLSCGLILLGTSFTGATAPLSMGVNLNLVTGVFMLGFGGTLLWLASRQS
jgi:hypothetical protein